MSSNRTLSAKHRWNIVKGAFEDVAQPDAEREFRGMMSRLGLTGTDRNLARERDLERDLGPAPREPDDPNDLDYDPSPRRRKRSARRARTIFQQPPVDDVDDDAVEDADADPPVDDTQVDDTRVDDAGQPDDTHEEPSFVRSEHDDDEEPSFVGSEHDDMDDDRVADDVLEIRIPVRTRTLRLVTLQDKVDFVGRLLDRCVDILHVDFDHRSVARAILNGEKVVGLGETQSGKTVLLLVVALCSFADGRPCVVVGCDTMSNVTALSEKLRGMLTVINGLDELRLTSVVLDVVCMTDRTAGGGHHNVRNVDATARDGRTVLMLSHTVSQLDRARAWLEKPGARSPNVVLDEADKFWSTRCDDDADGAGMIQREVSFYRLAGGRQLRGLHSLFQVSATPPDCIAWHVDHDVPLTCVALDKDACRIKRGYVGIEAFRPLQSEDGEPVFLRPGQVSRKTSYGLHDPAVKKMYDDVERERVGGRLGLLLIDVTNPRVYAEGNTIARAQMLAEAYPRWDFLVINGKGVYRVSPSGDATLEVCFRAPRTSRFGSLKALLNHLDATLHRPVCLIGYGMIRRSLSVRSNLRVPTHVICAPCKGTSLADFMQMIGRATGKNGGVLAGGHVTALVSEEDWDAAVHYDAFVRDVLLSFGGGRVAAFESHVFPERYRSVLRTGRKQGQPRLRTTEIMNRARFGDPTPRRPSTTAVTLSEEQRRILVRLSRVRSCPTEELGNGHRNRSDINVLKNKGCVRSERRGEWSITDRGRRCLLWGRAAPRPPARLR